MYKVWEHVPDQENQFLETVFRQRSHLVSESVSLTSYITLVHIQLDLCLWGPLQKDARRKTMQLPGTNVSRSLTGTQLVTKRVMSLHPHNPQFWSKVIPPNIAIPAPRCGG